MSRIKNYICAIIMLFGFTMFSQNSVSEDPEVIQNDINYRIKQAQYDMENHDYFEAQQKLENALKIAIKADNKKSIGIIYCKIGKLLNSIEEPDEAIKSLIRASDVQRFSDDINRAETYKGLGNAYVNKKDYTQALDYFKSAISLFEQEGIDEYVAEVLLNEGETFILINNYNQANASLERSIALARRYDLDKILSRALIFNGKLSSLQGNHKKGLNLVNEGLQIAKQNSFSNVLNEGYLIASDINQELKNYKEANDYLKQHIRLSDSILDVKRQHLSPEKRVQFILDNQPDYQKEDLEDLEKLKGKESLNRLTTILSVALITILSLLTLSLYKNNNIRLKTNNMLHKKNGELIIAKEKAELASKTKANFLSTVTHELRTPLYAVTGLSNMLLDEDPKPEQVKHLKSLKFSGDYLLTFINDILQINKIEANKVDIEPEVFNLKKKISNVISALNNSALDNNIKIHFEYDKELPENYIADQLKISQILINLIGNSIKFTKDGDIWVRAI